MTATLPTATDPQPETETLAVPARRSPAGGLGVRPAAPVRPLVRFRSSAPTCCCAGRCCS